MKDSKDICKEFKEKKNNESYMIMLRVVGTIVAIEKV
jgi:hypothetical protein